MSTPRRRVDPSAMKTGGGLQGSGLVVFSQKAWNRNGNGCLRSGILVGVIRRNRRVRVRQTGFMAVDNLARPTLVFPPRD